MVHVTWSPTYTDCGVARHEMDAAGGGELCGCWRLTSEACPSLAWSRLSSGTPMPIPIARTKTVAAFILCGAMYIQAINSIQFIIFWARIKAKDSLIRFGAPLSGDAFALGP